MIIVQGPGILKLNVGYDMEDLIGNMEEGMDITAHMQNFQILWRILWTVKSQFSRIIRGWIKKHQQSYKSARILIKVYLFRSWAFYQFWYCRKLVKILLNLSFGSSIQGLLIIWLVCRSYFHHIQLVLVEKE